MILSRKPLSLAEVKEYTKNLDESKPIHKYLKTFGKLNKADALKLAQEIRDLNNVKIKEEDIVKIVDLLPQDSSDVNKILLSVSLTEEEANTILEIVKKY